MLDIFNETTISLTEACKLLPKGRSGATVNFSTLWRWATKGAKAQDGSRVQLEVARLGGRLLTSKEALQRFSARLTGDIGQQQPTPRTPGQRHRASERASRQLDEAGI